ncbi:MAG: hypothetical protein JOY68_11575 [Candidatus Dormibacteraeota bacterium]|nr:hypothetical protein [Candidatus Dormibacteraeota bacterium]
MAQADVLENGMFHRTLPAGNYVVIGSISSRNLRSPVTRVCGPTRPPESTLFSTGASDASALDAIKVGLTSTP